MGSFPYFLPEIILSAFFLIAIIVDIIIGKKNQMITPIVALLGLFIGFVLSAMQYNLFHDLMQNQKIDAVPLFAGMLTLDRVAVFFKLLFVLSGILGIALTLNSRTAENARGMGEFYAILIAVVLGMNLMSMASHLLMMFIAIELVSLGSYVLVTYTRTNPKSAESGLKYVIYGGVSSGFMIYGISLLYGFTGTMGLNAQFVTGLSEIPYTALTIAVLMVLAGIGYKIAMFPFHFWSPDVYEGAPTPVTAFLAVGPKAAGFALLIRFLIAFTTSVKGVIVPSLNMDWVSIIALLAMLSMTFGNFSALWQNNVKRMLAYSSIAHAGYMLMGVVALSVLGISSVMFYLTVYLIMNMGAFIVLSMITEKIGSEDIRDFKGLGYKMPVLGVCLVLFMVSLTGLPPTAGFAGKLMLFQGLYEAWRVNPYSNMTDILFWLMVVGVVNSVVSLFYYFKIPLYMFVRQNEQAPEMKMSVLGTTLAVILAVPTLLIGISFNWLMDFIQKSFS
ncbi:MAG: NADH-quinone oxidoreductase subunit N [Bacteroidia bacterium]|nr:NADH-quinone oxidoreductase subunit N [Bacteroidia bacterium]MDW8348344.1 NADH-quinone oxidoreductase subunit N [Bacteroidia bacterium]